MPRQVVIIGNSGAARECYWNARDMMGDAFRFKGFLAFEGFSGNLKELSGLEIGDDDGYSPAADDEFIIGIGKPALRATAYAKWKERGARFLTLIHPFSFIPPDTVMGEGNIITCACHFSRNVTLGNANYCNGNVVMGHDVRVGDANFFGAFSLIMGEVAIGSQNGFGIRAAVLPGATIGDGNTIAPGAYVYKGCGSGRLLAGNPALDVRGEGS
jgi:Acyl-[acyl carrier protein]--UDP-N-acetylglucosamine O-acyltransferase